MKGPTAVLQRKCACGKEANDGVSCAECNARESGRLQRCANNSPSTSSIALVKPGIGDYSDSAFELTLSDVQASAYKIELKRKLLQEMATESDARARGAF